MPAFNFRRFFNIEIGPVIKGLLDGIGHVVAILDERKRFLYGEKNQEVWVREYEVSLEGKVVGYVMGEPRAFWVSKILNYLADEHLAAQAMDRQLEEELLNFMRLEDDVRQAREALAIAEAKLRDLTRSIG